MAKVGMNKDRDPLSSDWRPHTAPNSEDCTVKICPKCARPGCVEWWKDIDHEGFKVLAFRHAHFLKDTFEQRRNYNHLVEGSRYRIKAGELIVSTRLAPNKIPEFIARQFRDI